jgi:NCS2 family nucleobase:cation symporter-2
VLVGLNVKRLRVLFPPLITGTVVFTIGLSLYPTAINYMAGGVGSPSYGSAQNWLLAFLTLAIVTVLNHMGKGIFKLASILIGIAVGYILSLLLGIVDFTAVSSASLFQAPRLMHFGLRFEVAACFSGILLRSTRSRRWRLTPPP